MRLIVVRHASAKSKGAWKGRDEDRPLTVNGTRQAKAISARFARYEPARVLSSPSLRCIETISPLASARAMGVETTDALGRDGGERAIKLVSQLLAKSPAPSTIVICTHREVIVRILPVIASRLGSRLGHRLPGAKGSSWIVTTHAGRRSEIKYWRSTA